MPYIHHKFGKTFYIKQGKGPKPPLVYLHGGPGSRLNWNLPILNLSKDRRVFLYDQIGGGKSSPTTQRRWNIKTFVEELDILVKAWGLTDFHLAGVSWGSTLAVEYYLFKRGQGIRSLVLTSPMFSADDWKADAESLIRKLPSKFRNIIRSCHEIGATDSRVYREATVAYYLKHVLRSKKKLMAGMAQAIKSKNSGRAVYEHMWGPSEFAPTGTLKKYNRVGGLKKINIPTLFMCGEFDEATPATVKRYSKLVKGSQFRILKGCSHASTSENPKLVLRSIREFLKD